MQTRRATELNHHSGEILEEIISGPVLITKGKLERPVAVIMSYTRYMQLTGNTHVVEVRQGNIDETSPLGVNVEKPSHSTGTLAASRVPVNGPPDRR